MEKQTLPFEWDPNDPLTDDAIAGTYRLYQRKKGHRFSLDDVATAWEAANAVPNATRYLDLGCGIGSVLHMVSWKLSNAKVVGVEAQEISFSLVTKNVARNGTLGERTTLIHGDLRDLATVEKALAHGPFELVSGTPPYAPPGTSTLSPDSQRAHARAELRGGVEEYLKTGAKLVAPGGRVVVCCDARTPERPLSGAKEAGLVALKQREVVPRAGVRALFTVWTFARAEDAPGATLELTEPLVIRDADGVRTAQARAMRVFFDVEPNENE